MVIDLREDVLELNGGHIHSYVATHDLPYQLQACIVKLNCPAPFRWRWSDLFDWTYCERDPREYD